MTLPRFILGVDPGFANFGWALIRLEGGKEYVHALGVINTEKSDAKRKVLASDDNFRRARELAKRLRQIATTPTAVCAESMSFPRSSSVAAKIAMSWGVLADYCQASDSPMFMATPKELKRAVCGNAAASKEDVQAAMRKRFSDQNLDEMLVKEGIPKGKWEHSFDAIAAIVACLDSEGMRLLRRTES